MTGRHLIGLAMLITLGLVACGLAVVGLLKVAAWFGSLRQKRRMRARWQEAVRNPGLFTVEHVAAAFDIPVELVDDDRPRTRRNGVHHRMESEFGGGK